MPRKRNENKRYTIPLDLERLRQSVPQGQRLSNKFDTQLWRTITQNYLNLTKKPSANEAKYLYRRFLNISSNLNSENESSYFQIQDKLTPKNKFTEEFTVREESQISEEQPIQKESHSILEERPVPEKSPDKEESQIIKEPPIQEEPATLKEPSIRKESPILKEPSIQEESPILKEPYVPEKLTTQESYNKNKPDEYGIDKDQFKIQTHQWLDRMESMAATISSKAVLEVTKYAIDIVTQHHGDIRNEQKSTLPISNSNRRKSNISSDDIESLNADSEVHAEVEKMIALQSKLKFVKQMMSFSYRKLITQQLIS